MTLFECSTSLYPSSNPSSWDIWVKSSGDVCNSNLLTPRDWDACITPVAVWTISSTGTLIAHTLNKLKRVQTSNSLNIIIEMKTNFSNCYAGQYLPHHVGIPIGGRSGAKYYMLEIHYDNPKAKRGKLSLCIALKLTARTTNLKRFVVRFIRHCTCLYDDEL